jgi:hypothetical protein
LFAVHPESTERVDGAAAEFRDLIVLPNLRAGIRWIATQQPRTEGIDEIADDPRYENLYDRFWAIMSDGAILEHLAVAAIVEPTAELADMGVAHLTALADAWAPETRRPANYGNAYANSRLLKSIAVAWSTFRPALTAEQDGAVSAMLTALAGTLWDQWFSKAPVRGPVGMGADQHSPHHASVEWSAFGVAGLALLGTVDAAQVWVDASIEHFSRDLLPRALAADGSSPEGWDYWLSTMFSRAQFMDAARNVIGVDLLAEHPECIRMDQAFGLCRKVPPMLPKDEGQDRLLPAEWPLLPRSFGSTLLWFAARLGDPHLQALGMLDVRAGAIETGSFASPVSGLRHRLPMNCYAPLWMSTVLQPDGDIDDAPVSLPAISICAAPRGWRQPDRFSAVIFEGRVMVWFGEHLVYQDLDPERVVDLEASREAGTGIYSCEYEEQWGATVGVSRQTRGRAGSRDTVDLLEARNDDDVVVARVWLLDDGRRVRVDRMAGPSRRWRTTMALTPAFGDGEWNLSASPERSAERGIPAVTVALAVSASVVEPGGRADVKTIAGYGLLECVDDPPAGTLDDHLLVTGAGWCHLDFAVDQGATAASGPSDAP